MTATVSKLKPKKVPGKMPWKRVHYDFEDITKMEKAIGPAGVEELSEMEVSELADYLVRNANYIEETQQALKADSNVEKLKKALKEAKAPYQETLKDLRARRSFVVKLITEKNN